MKVVERTLFIVKDLYNPANCNDVMNRLFEIANNQGRNGRMLGSVSVEKHPERDDEVQIKCIEIVSDAEYALMLEKGEVKEKKPNETHEEEVKAAEENKGAEPQHDQKEAENEPQG